MLIPILEAEPVFNERTERLASFVASLMSPDFRLAVDPETFLAEVRGFMPEYSPSELRAALKIIGDMRREAKRRRKRRFNRSAPTAH